MTESVTLRRGVLALAWVAVAGTALELALERHWQNGTQLIAWGVTALALVALALVTVRPIRGRLWAGRAVAAVVLLLSAFDAFQHVSANYDAGELDAVYAARWPSMSEPARWRAVVLKSVGPVPILAAGVLAEVAVLVLLSTVGHPALMRERQG